jgi:hypothetical protein
MGLPAGCNISFGPADGVYFEAALFIILISQLIQALAASHPYTSIAAVYRRED